MSVLAGEAFERLVLRRVAFEKERGVTSVSNSGRFAYLVVPLSPDRPRAEQELEIYRRIAARSISINLVKLHRQSVSFVIDEPQGAYHGGDVAAPVFREIAKKLMLLLDVNPKPVASR